MIRRYRNRDLEALLDVWYRASIIAHSFLPADFLEAEKREIAQTWLPMAETTVYEMDGRLVGFLALIGNEVGAIFVDPDYQGRGVGRSLMDQARDSRPLLELSVFEANSSGRDFYERCGFEYVGSQINQATGHPEIRLRLSPDRSARSGRLSS